VNVTRGSSAVAAGLAPLLTASQTEGFRFVTRLVAKIADGNFEEPGAALFGAYDYGVGLVGVVGLTRDPYVAEPYGKEVGRVRHLYVLPAYRSKGADRALLAALVGEARLHYRVLQLRTDTPAAAFTARSALASVRSRMQPTC
jgi:GNAT superfamily N-acetyltransferase